MQAWARIVIISLIAGATAALAVWSGLAPAPTADASARTQFTEKNRLSHLP